MRQWVALDPTPRASYYFVLGALVFLGAALGCRASVDPIAPVSMPELTESVARQWVDSLVPSGPRRYDVRWTVETQKGQVRGRASARVVPPDSLRFDYRAPFGRSGAAVLIGDSLLWAKPEERNPVPPAPLFWAALGIPLYPRAGAAITGRPLPTERAWRYAFNGDTLTYVITTSESRRLRALFRRGGNVIGTVETEFEESAQWPTRATVLFPRSGALFLMTVQEVEPLAQVDSSIWEEP